jgi:redox-sensitive bicupin YhaK (pirin superfamily)
MQLVIHARRRSLGGFDVGRVLPFAQHRMVGPFVFFDHMGPITFPPDIPHSTDVRPHPHIGLSTITYLLDGEVTHRDSLGVEQVIRPGEVNWMTAGRGITHSERFDGMRKSGGSMDGIQAWIALPAEHEETEPAFDHYAREDLPAFEDRGVSLRLIAGHAFGAKSGVKTFSPVFYAHATLHDGGRIAAPSDYSERAIYVARGLVESENQLFDEGQMLVFAPGEDADVRAHGPAEVMLLGGEPVGERHIWWNFVSSRPERIEQAKADWRAGRIPLPEHDKDEFIPLPDDPPPPKPEPMS